MDFYHVVGTCPIHGPSSWIARAKDGFAAMDLLRNINQCEVACGDIAYETHEDATPLLILMEAGITPTGAATRPLLICLFE